MLERVTRFMGEKSTERGSWVASNHFLGGNAGLCSASVNTLWMLKKSCSMELSFFIFLPPCKLFSDQWERVTLIRWTGYVGLVLSLPLVGKLFNTVVSFSLAHWMSLRQICSVVRYSLQTRITQWKEIRHRKEIGCSFWQHTPSDKVQGREEHSYSSVLLPSYSVLPNSQDEQSCLYLTQLI